jgi:hypothetical protein
VGVIMGDANIVVTIKSKVISTFPPNSLDQTKVDPAARGTTPVIIIPTNKGKLIISILRRNSPTKKKSIGMKI